MGWGVGRDEKELGGKGVARTSQPPVLSLGAIDFTWCCEFLGCHLDFSRASSPTQDPVGWAGLSWTGLGGNRQRPPDVKPVLLMSVGGSSQDHRKWGHKPQNSEASSWGRISEP